MTIPNLRRIALLSVHTCPLATLGGKDTGGMNVYVRELAREFSRRGLATDVFTRSQDVHVPRLNHRLGSHARVIHIPAGPEEPINKNLIYDYLPEFVAGVAAFAEAESIHYDILHSHYWLSGLAAEALRKRWGTPYVHMFHTLAALKNRVAQTPEERESELRVKCEGEIVHSADRIIAATALERQQLQELYGADPERIAVVPPGVDLALFHPQPCAQARANIGIPPNQHMVLFVGRVQPIKGIDTLLRAMALVLRDRPGLRGNVYLTLIGGDPDTPDPELERLVALREALGIGDLVTFLGSRDQDTLVDYYSAASVLVVPSHYESFGMVALEAMACGTPVIASDVGGLSFNVSDGFNGYLVPDGDPEALAYKITLLLTQDTLRRQLGSQARRWAERFSWHTIADEILAVYQDVLGGSSDDFASVTRLERRAAWQGFEERSCP